MDQVITDTCPCQTDRLIADVVRHGRGTRREDRQISTALTLQLQLRTFEAAAYLLIADIELAHIRGPARTTDGGELRITEGLQLCRSRGVVAVAVDDHTAMVSGSDRPAQRARRILQAACQPLT